MSLPSPSEFLSIEESFINIDDVLPLILISIAAIVTLTLTNVFLKKKDGWVEWILTNKVWVIGVFIYAHKELLRLKIYPTDGGYCTVRASAFIKFMVYHQIRDGIHINRLSDVKLARICSWSLRYGDLN